VALIFSLTALLNVGISGVALVFWLEPSHLTELRPQALGIGLALVGAVSASLGNMVAARNHGRGLPVVQLNAFGMLYGIVALLISTVFEGLPWRSHTLLGAGLCVAGNVLLLKRGKKGWTSGNSAVKADDSSR
jgi:drug/metabolite transporter (DMT)-like permease